MSLTLATIMNIQIHQLVDYKHDKLLVKHDIATDVMFVTLLVILYPFHKLNYADNIRIIWS